MPSLNFTSKLLELEDAIVDDLFISDFTIHISLTMKRMPHRCPHCGSWTEQVHDYRPSIIKDLPIMGKQTLLHYKKRRYHCPACNHHFYEAFPGLPKYCHITTRLAFYSIHLLRNTQNVRSVSHTLGISASSVFRRMSDVQYPVPRHLPTVLSIDEFRGNAGGQKFQAILTDAASHKLFDILPSRSQVSLMTYFQQFKNRNQVRYFVMDMNQVYRDIALSYFPNATIVIDRFHVVRYVTWALENIRKRIQKQMHPSKRKYFKRSRRILLAHQSKLSRENLDALEIMLMQSNDLAVAYHLKELFYEFMSSENRIEAGKRLHTFILATQVSQLNEFKPCLTMLGNWSKYILNSFDCPYNNGYTEGTNNTIKVIKRNAYGYRNFNNFRNRIFLSLAK